MLKAAWQNVKQVSIVNCFAKAGFVPETPSMEEDVGDPPPGMTVPDFHTYMDMDMSLSCHGKLTDDEICNSIRGTTDPEQQCESEEEGKTTSTSVAPNACDAIQAMHTINSKFRS